MSITLAGTGVAENATRASAGRLTVSGGQAGETFTYTVSDARFEVIGGALRLKPATSLDFEAAPQVPVTVTATGSTGSNGSAGFTIAVTNVNEAPTDIALSGQSVREGAAGATLGRITVLDQDAGDSQALSLSDSRFAIVGSTLRLKRGTALTLADDDLILNVTSTDLGGLSRTESFTIDVIDADFRPVALSPATLPENARRVTIGTLSVTDAAPGEIFTYSFSDRRFAADGSTLKLVSNSLNHETTPVFNLQVTVTNASGGTFLTTVPITVTDVNEAPVFTVAPAVITVREGDAGIALYRGADPDDDAVLTYRIAGGTDAALFTINPTDGALAFITARDFETRTDFNRDGIYNVTVSVSDGALSASQDVQVWIADVQETGGSGVFRRRVDFAPEGSPLAPGFLADTGKAFNELVGYGWVTEASVADGTANGTIPDAIDLIDGAVFERPDPTGLIEDRLRTVAQFEPDSAPPGSAQRYAWEHAVVNGTYLIRVAIGDVGGANDSVNVLNVEGQNVLDGFVPTTYLRSVLVTTTVTVTDGRLTLDSIGGTNTEIQSIRFEQLRDQTPTDGRPVEADYTFVREAVAVAGGGTPVELNRATDVDQQAAFSIGIGNIDPLDPVDRDTINTTTIRLVETLTGTRVVGTVNTDAVGGTITFQPDVALKANTAYSLIIDGVRTESGEEVITGTSSFATGLTVPPGSDIAFARQEMDVSASTPYASIAISPDGDYLYATSLAGTITRWSIDEATGVLRNEQIFAPPELAGRALIGLAFDPTQPDVLWITNNDPLGAADAPDFSGKISRITIGSGTSFTATVEDYVVGLPRSVRDHLANSLAFHQDETGDWKLYLTQGSNNATGAPDNAWGNRPERLLNAAVLEIDPDRNVSGGPINVQTQDPNVVLPSGAGAQVGFYNPFAAGAPVQLFATGVRNGYDLVWHSNGRLYVAANGSASGGNTPDDPTTAIDESLTGVGAQNDYLFDVREGFYYGHPVPVRGEYILNGGNPTAGDDGPNEVAPDSRYEGYPVGVAPPANYGGYAYNFSQGRSPNGSAEYFGTAFDGALTNALLVVEYSGGKDIVALRFDEQGRVIDDADNPFLLDDAAGNPLRFANPLDIATDASGRIYVAQLNGEGGAITLLTPTAPNPTPPEDRLFEAEAATLAGGTIRVSTTQDGFSGAGYADFRTRSGESITWTFDVVAAGIYRVGFRYALGAKATDLDGRPLTFAVNGMIDQTLPFVPQTPNPKDWVTVFEDVELKLGTNTISLTSIGDSGPNIDWLSVSPTPVTAINTLPTVGGSQADLSFAAGQPIAFVIDGITASDLDPADVAQLQARLLGGAPLPIWLEFDPGTNQFTSNQTAVPVPGVYDIEIVADDGKDESRGAIVFGLEIVRQVNPADVDADGTLNAADADDDNDGIADLRDPFQADPRNGQGTTVVEGRTLFYDFAQRPFGADPGYGLGITGLHLSGGRTPEQLGLGTPNLTIGGGKLHIENAGTGDLATANLTLGAQFGVDLDTRFVRISATFDNPFDGRAPARGANFGLLIGTGGADDYVKLVLEGQSATGAFLQMETRLDGVRQDAASPSFGRTQAALFRAADADDTVTFTFDLDTVAGTLTASWALRNGADLITGTAAPITLTGDLLEVVQGDYTIAADDGSQRDSGLSVGIVASSRNTTPALDVDLLDITVSGLVADPEITLISGDSPLLGSRAVFNFIADPTANNGPPGANPPRLFKDTATIVVRNDGDDTLNVTGLELSKFFRFATSADALPFTLEAGQERAIDIRFDSRLTVFDPEQESPLFTGTLKVFSNDGDEPMAVADLAGFYQAVPEGGQEPNFNQIMEIFGLGTRADLGKFDNFDVYRAAGPDEVLSPYWRIADGFTQVTVTQLAALHDISQAAFFLYEPGNGTSDQSIGVLTHDSQYNQSFLPQRNTGTEPTITFDAATIPDGWDGSDVFGIRVAGQFSDPTLNTDGPGQGPPGEQRGHFLRIFEARDASGTLIANTYVVAQDYQGINYDYQDNLYLIQGIAAVDQPFA